MLLLYKTKIIRVTETFRSTIMIATGAIFLIFVVNMIGSFLPILKIPMVADATPIGIAFTAIVCIIAALNLILDFNNIEIGANNRLPKVFEWYMAFGLMVTIIWLYIEILRLLVKLRGRD